MQKKRQDVKPDSNSSVSSDSQDSRELLKSIIGFMRQNQQLELSELLSIYSETSPEQSVPVSIFSGKLSPSEALCLFLKQDRGLSFHDIAVLLNRDDRSVWTSCARAKKKSKKQFTEKDDDILLPISMFTDRSLSIMEHVVDLLTHQHKMTNSQIAKMLNRNPSAIATVANRAESKKATKKTKKNTIRKEAANKR